MHYCSFLGSRSTSINLLKMLFRLYYSHTPGVGYHKLHTVIADWPTARRICKAEGAHLAIINSVAEAAILSGLLIQANIPEIVALSPSSANVYVRQAAVGIHDLFQEHEWVTIHDESLADTGFTEWDFMEPNNSAGIEHCGALRSNKKLNNVPCSHRQPFICELPSSPICGPPPLFELRRTYICQRKKRKLISRCHKKCRKKDR